MSTPAVLVWVGELPVDKAATLTARVVAVRNAEAWGLVVETRTTDAFGADAWTPVPKYDPFDPSEMNANYTLILEAALKDRAEHFARAATVKARLEKKGA